ncbi:MAG: (Fe-S)-binding protein [Lewinellaceae bacterium]|nr:(Fe-S)-binding protein [Saprospiraceae bacterium]MCB9311490.1 (Fe-S)-binding protein [Lewinellaceae bacterium]HRW76327.1 (Fe-S)-binding protein [Saprospiraceae bacterium]
MEHQLQIRTLADWAASGERPEFLFWVGCAGSFDDRAQKVTIDFCKILHHAGITFGILGNEEACTGDPARRAGNEFVFQMLAIQNIQTLNGYEVTKIVATCPHCFNTLKNEYPELGGHYEVWHHTQLINHLLHSGALEVDANQGNETITYHDSCYLGRINGEYDSPRNILEQLKGNVVEMNRIKANGLCCGAGGGQMWKEDEPGDRRINVERAEEALQTGARTIAVNCPFCLTMMSDGVKAKDQQDNVMVYDLAELIVRNNKW